MNKDLKLHHQTPITKSEIIIDSVKRFLRRGAISHVSKIVGKMHPADIARLINEVEKKTGL